MPAIPSTSAATTMAVDTTGVECAQPAMLPIAVCEQARLSRDARFDGLFFTAVRTTGIYCRPICPAPTPHARNVRYFPNAASAEAAGYRPCLRCRPELSPAAGAGRRGDDVVARASRMIDDGALDAAGIEALAARLHVGPRHLRRLFVDTLGTSPRQLQNTRRLLFAKQLLAETTLPITDVALAAGFNSLRRFNDAFLHAYGLAPTRLRRKQGPVAARPRQALVLRLAYRPPFDFHASLAFLRTRALPGVEAVAAGTYRRLLDATGAWLQVEAWGGDEPALRLSLHGVAAAALPRIVQRVRRMFDLDADPQAIHAHLRHDPRLRALLDRHPGLRLPGGWDGFEVAIRAVLGQQVSVAAASTLATRLLARCGSDLPNPTDDALRRLFPAPEVLAEADLAGIGLTGARSATLRALARAVCDQRLRFDPAQPLDAFVAACCALPGIGDWTAHYLALRALGHPDAFPAGDLVLRKQVGGGVPISEKQLRLHAEHWRPWRGYAAIQLWHAASAGSASAHPAVAARHPRTQATGPTASHGERT